MKITLLPPDIDTSNVEFTIENGPPGNLAAKRVGEAGRIRFGLSAIKNVGEAAIESILAARNKGGKFASLVDFCQRIDLQKVNKKTMESLIKTGAMDAFGKRASMLVSLSKIMEDSHRQKRQQNLGQASLFGELPHNDQEDLVDIEELSRVELLSFERELLGFYLTEHPLRPVLASLSNKITHQIVDLADLNPGTKVLIGGVVTQIKKILTRQSNSEMAFVKLEDLTGIVEVIVFPKVYAQNKDNLILDKIVTVLGKVDFKDERVMVIAEKISLFE